MAEIFDSMTAFAPQQDTVMPNAITGLSPETLRMIGGMNQGVALPSLADYGPMTVDPNMYRPIQSGTPFDILSGIGKQMQYDAASKQAAAEKARYEQDVGIAKQKAIQQAMEERKNNAINAAKIAVATNQIPKEMEQQFVALATQDPRMAKDMMARGQGNPFTDAMTALQTKTNMDNALKQNSALDELDYAISNVRRTMKPEYFGAAGILTKTVQDVREQAPAFIASLNSLSSGVKFEDPEFGSAKFDPNLPAQEYWLNSLIAAQAKANNPTGVISNQDWKQAENAVRGGLVLGNYKSMAAKTEEMMRKNHFARESNMRLLNPSYQRTEYQETPFYKSVFADQGNTSPEKKETQPATTTAADFLKKKGLVP